VAYDGTVELTALYPSTAAEWDAAPVLGTTMSMALSGTYAGASPGITDFEVNGTIDVRNLGPLGRGGTTELCP
jgi:hypothetical protein